MFKIVERDYYVKIMPEKSRIAIIDHVGSKAGMDYYSGLLAKEIANNGATCLLISNFKLSNPAIKCYPYFAQHLSNNLQKAINYFIAFFRAALRCRMSGCQDAIVHVFSYDFKDLYAFRVLRFFNIRITAIIHDVESFAGGTSAERRMKMLDKLAYHLVVHNRFSYEQLTAGDGKILQAKTKIIPHGNFHSLYDTKITKQEAKKHFHLDGNKQYLLFFGQIKEVKGLEILLKALPLLPENIHLVIAGKPWKNDFERYELLIKKLGVENRIVQMIGFVTDEDRDLLFKACDLLVLPYKQIFQSGVMLMAMSYRIPLVASDLAPIKEVITDQKTGFLFTSENEHALSEAILRALNNPGLLEVVAQNAWEETRAKNDWNKIAHAIINW